MAMVESLIEFSNKSTYKAHGKKLNENEDDGGEESESSIEGKLRENSSSTTKSGERWKKARMAREMHPRWTYLAFCSRDCIVSMIAQSVQT